MATIQFKRGTAARWEDLNPILEAGQPGVEFRNDGTTQLKIGDGITAWNDLPYVGEANVINMPTRYDFPSVGRETVIYKAEQEKMLYQWNTIELKYEVVGSSENAGDLSSIEIIHGGNAAGE